MTIAAVPTDTEHDTELKARFAAEVWQHVDQLSRKARALTHNDADAEDLLQETLLHAYTGFHTFTDGTNLKAWLYRIMHNQWINAYRWRERRPAELLSGDITDHHLADSRARASAEAEVLDALPDSDIRTAMAALSDGFRMVIYYADIEGYTYAETAAVMGIPIGTVMSRVSRARIQLRRLLAHLDHTSAELAA
jgi:RNA polymerase sigma-70 factor (ECF subfamily)